MENKEYDILQTMHGSYKTILSRKYIMTRKPWVPDDPKVIKSHIPGTIVEIRVKEGDKVKAGDIMILFRAMKMNNNIKAKEDGVIKKVLVKEGENIPSHTAMIEME